MKLDPKNLTQFATLYVDRYCHGNYFHKKQNRESEYGLNWYEWLYTCDEEVRTVFLTSFDQEKFIQLMIEQEEHLVNQLDDVRKQLELAKS